MGLGSNPEGEVSKGLPDIYQQNLLGNESPWKVYIRGKGCRKKKAQNHSIDPPHAELSNMAESRTEELLKLQSFKESTVRQNILKDPGPREPETHPATTTSQDLSLQSNTAIQDEAIALWDVAKELGLTSETDQSKIIDKITAMEVRDRKEAQEFCSENTRLNKELNMNKKK